MMLDNANKSPKIGLVGDTWLKKVADVLIHFYPDAGIVFIAETATADKIDAALAGCDITLSTWREDAHFDVICPRFHIDGLCTIEMSGAGGSRTFLGAAPLMQQIDVAQDMKLIVAALQGEIEFNCVARFDDSIAALKHQEQTAVPISDFLLARYKAEPILTGCKKPAPNVTFEMAKRIAANLSWDIAVFDKVDHLLLGSLAIKASRRCTMPYDAQKLGLTYEADPFWFPNFGGLFKDIAADFRKAVKNERPQNL